MNFDDAFNDALDKAFAKVSNGGKQPSKKDDGHKSPPKGYPESKEKYADPANYKYPIDSADHVRSAWSYINQEKNQKGYTPEELAYIKNRIKKAAKKFGVQIND